MQSTAEMIWQKTMIIDKLINDIILFKTYGVCKVTNRTCCGDKELDL